MTVKFVLIKIDYAANVETKNHIHNKQMVKSYAQKKGQ